MSEEAEYILKKGKIIYDGKAVSLELITKQLNWLSQKLDEESDIYDASEEKNVVLEAKLAKIQKIVDESTWASSKGYGYRRVRRAIREVLDHE